MTSASVFCRVARPFVPSEGIDEVLTVTRGLISSGRHGRAPGSYEYQMLYEIRPSEQRQLVTTGSAVRVYVTYGDDWNGCFMRSLAELPANTFFSLRSEVTAGTVAG